MGTPKEILKKMAEEAPKETTEAESYTNCEYCGGIGAVHPMVDGKVDYSRTIPCSCSTEMSKKKRLDNLIASCALPPYAMDMNFENLEIYPEVKTAYESAVEMANKPGELAWLAFIGENGNGKTHLSVSICKAWIKAGIPARYTFVSLLLDELREGFKKEDSENSYTNKFQYFCNVPLLLLDDYGMESKTAWVQEKLDTIVDYRLMNNKSLLVTSNLALDDMPIRIRSRLARHPKGKVIEIAAPDYVFRRKLK
jgi:DNA replication protein DnaC